MKKRYYEEIYDYLKDIVIIDTHEHIPVAEKYRDQQTDLLKEYMTYYFCSDLVSAGYQNMDYLKDISKPVMDRWLDVEPYWELARYTVMAGVWTILQNYYTALTRLIAIPLKRQMKNFWKRCMGGITIRRFSLTSLKLQSMYAR